MPLIVEMDRLAGCRSRDLPLPLTTDFGTELEQELNVKSKSVLQVFHMATPTEGEMKQCFGCTPTSAEHSVDIAPPAELISVGNHKTCPLKHCFIGTPTSADCEAAMVFDMEEPQHVSVHSLASDAVNTKSESSSRCSSSTSSTPRWMTACAAPTENDIMQAVLTAYSRRVDNDDSDFECESTSDASDEDS